MSRNKKVDWDDVQLLTSAVKDKLSYTQVLAALGLGPIGRNYDTLRSHLERHNIQFISQPHLIIRSNSISSNEDLFVANSTVRRNIIRNRIIKNNLIPYVCRDCGIANSWNNKPITLQLEHINGINNDHRLVNLTFLCPNRHSQTETWAGRGSTKRSVMVKKPIANPKLKKPAVLRSLTDDELLVLVKYNTLSQVGSMYGVGGNTVRRELQVRKLPNVGLAGRQNLQYLKVLDIANVNK